MKISKKELAGVMKEILSEVGLEDRVAPDGDSSAKSETDHLSAIQAIRDANANRYGNIYLGDEKSQRGLAAARFVRAMAAARGDAEKAIDCLNKWGDADIAAAVTASMSKDLAAGTATAGAELIPSPLSTDLIELLRDATVIRRLNPVTIPMENGTITIPRQTGAATASYVAENAAVNATEPTTDDITLTWKKLIAVVPVSNDLLRFTNPQNAVAADQLVRDDLVASLSNREDIAFIRDSGAGNTPTGLANVTGIGTDVSAGTTAGAVTLAQVISDVRTQLTALKSANSRMLRPAWIMTSRSEVFLMTLQDSNGQFVFRDEMANGRYFGLPYATTNAVPDNLGTGTDESEIYLVDFADVIIGDSNRIELTVSEQAAYNDSGGTVVAAFSKDQTVVKAIARHDIQVRHAASIHLLTGVHYGT